MPHAWSNIQRTSLPATSVQVTPCSFLSLYFFPPHFERGKISQDEVANVPASWLAGHRCQLTSWGPSTSLDQVVRSPFLSSARKYTAYFLTLSCYFLKLPLYPMLYHAITITSLPRPVSVLSPGSKYFPFPTNRAAALWLIVNLQWNLNSTERMRGVQKDQQ